MALRWRKHVCRAAPSRSIPVALRTNRDQNRVGSTARRPRHVGSSEHRTAGRAGDGTGGRPQPIPKVDWAAVQSEGAYGYRPNKSALDAIGVTRERCWKYDWVLEFDIRGLFDNIDHTLLLRAVRKHVKCGWALLYIERWLT